MKVLLLSPLPPATGGLARWTERYLDSVEGKVDVHVVNTALIGKRASTAGEKRHVFEEIRRTVNIIRLTRKSFVTQYQLVHINSACSRFGIVRDYCCARIAKKHGAKVVLHCHCNVEDQLGTGRMANYFFNKILKIADQVLVLNRRSGMFVDSRVSVPVSTIMPNYIKRNQIAQSHKINDSIKKVVFVGDVRISKGCKEIYEVARICSAIKFQIIGPYTEEMDIYEKPNNVELLGVLSVDLVYRFLDDADVFLFPTHTEGFSNALLEAMARGVPVITTKVGANEDMIEKQGGTFVQIGNSKQIVNALDYLQDVNRRKCMSEWNVAKVKRCYEEKAVMERLLEIYEKTVNTKSY